MRKITKIGLMASSLTVLTILGGAGVVQALDDPLSPDFVQEDGSFYSVDQIDAVWASVTEDYPDALPANVSFPADAPSFFHPEDAERPIFQTGLPGLIAARYWRCAWLDVSLDGAELGQKTAATAAQVALNGYKELPAVKDLVDVDGYNEQINEYATTLGVTPAVAEFDLECGIYTEAGNVR
ncbi:hypothetical protein [Cryobacterium sp. M15]|jgi:hypothetical protein|uniref:hypothetical protein n=1 Tax=Cryobacterium sp. M15 TaxID=2048291 RepID=UPI000CE499DA|nr:hypothetical protein [Cryobacterium sp. M15]